MDGATAGIGATVSDAVVSPLVNPVTPACTAEIVVVPADRIVTTLPLTEATEALLLPYEKSPVLFEVGGERENAGLPTC